MLKLHLSIVPFKGFKIQVCFKGKKKKEKDNLILWSKILARYRVIQVKICHPIYFSQQPYVKTLTVSIFQSMKFEFRNVNLLTSKYLVQN